jgi:2-polyprenyl-3-methyl-5-hydroxy-6-metoxy-1,4-benzoquinol methylase
MTLRFESPRNVRDVAECAFYHYMDLPGIGQVGDHWDLRPTIDEYLGRFDFRGKRALDVGAASGYLTFEMEKRGQRRKAVSTKC